MSAPRHSSNSWRAVVSLVPALDDDYFGAPADYDYFTVSIPLGGGMAFFRNEDLEN